MIRWIWFEVKRFSCKVCPSRCCQAYALLAATKRCDMRTTCHNNRHYRRQSPQTNDGPVSCILNLVTSRILAHKLTLPFSQACPAVVHKQCRPQRSMQYRPGKWLIQIFPIRYINVHAIKRADTRLFQTKTNTLQRAGISKQITEKHTRNRSNSLHLQYKQFCSILANQKRVKKTK